MFTELEELFLLVVKAVLLSPSIGVEGKMINCGSKKLIFLIIKLFFVLLFRKATPPFTSYADFWK